MARPQQIPWPRSCAISSRWSKGGPSRSGDNTATLFVRQNIVIYLLTGRKPDAYAWQADGTPYDATHLLEHLRGPDGRVTVQPGERRRGGSYETVDVQAKNEIGALAHEFNQMVRALEERDRRLERAHQIALESERLAAIGRYC